MNSPSRRASKGSRLLLVACGALLFLISHAAVAAPPRDTKKLIVLGGSIGSVAIGDFWRDARAKWGGGGECSGRGRTQDATYACTFDTRRRGEASFEEGFVRYDDGEEVHGVRRIRLHAWLLRVRERWVGTPPNQRLRRVPTFAFERPYTSFRTANGIRLGSTAREFRQAYPGAKRVRRETTGFSRYDFKDYAVRRGDVRAVFEVAGGRVAGIVVESTAQRND